jgi:hypothetical protein
VTDHRPVPGYAAREEDRGTGVPVHGKRVDNVLGKPVAQPVADLFQAVSFLLGVNQIRFRKNGAPRCHFRHGPLLLQALLAQRFRTLQVQPSRLLIEETARPRRTGCIGSETSVPAVFVKTDQAEGFAPDNQDGADSG